MTMRPFTAREIQDAVIAAESVPEAMQMVADLADKMAQSRRSKQDQAFGITITNPPARSCTCSHDGPDPCCAVHVTSAPGNFVVVAKLPTYEPSCAYGHAMSMWDECVVCGLTGKEIAMRRMDAATGAPLMRTRFCQIHGWKVSLPRTTPSEDMPWCPACKAAEAEPPKPARRFCACGQEVWPVRGAVPLDYSGSPVCGDCSANEARRLWDGTPVEPLDQRIRAVQPETEEHAFERPGYSWP